jgi:mannose/fructose/N-acetylgalactosamine-specific phosphotransferase system component IIB|nr:PTS sugar transporter subunit IIB [Candidatus Krumholzibacteria bacterium]
MPIILARVDDRMIHGQVTVGWSQQLQPDRIVLANNEIAADPWQSRVYASSVPPEIRVSIFSIAETVSQLSKEAMYNQRVILLTASPGEMAELARLGAALAEVNIGGLHFSVGKKEMLPFVYVDRQDLTAMGRLLDQGIELFAQQVPGGKSMGLDKSGLEAMAEKL